MYKRLDPEQVEAIYKKLRAYEDTGLDPEEIKELLAKVPRWISVEERLPEPGERVLVSNGGFVCESFLSQSGKWQRGGVDMFFMTPTHWMPLPEAPKEVE
jgi:hypothetical protein